MPRTQVKARIQTRPPANRPPSPGDAANGTHAPEPRATLDGTSHYRTSDERSPHAARTRRSSRDGRSKKFFPPAPCDGPRKTVAHRPQIPSHLPRDVADNGEPVPDAADAPPHSGGTRALHASETSNERPDDRPGYNSGSAGEKAETDAHTLSTGNAAAAPNARSQPEARGPLDEGTNSQHAQRGPREGSLPKGQVSERSVNFSPRRSCLNRQPPSPSRIIGHPVACHTRQATL
jgi:hypothetical protein